MHAPPQTTKTVVVGSIVVTTLDWSQLDGTRPHDPRLESSRHVRISASRFPSFWIPANRPNMLGNMTPGQSTHMRTRTQQWHKSRNALTRTENHKHPKQVSLDATCEGFSQRTKVANTSWTTETANSATHAYHRWSCFFLPNSLSQSWRLDNPFRCDVQFNIDKIASRANQNWSIANIQIKIRWTRHQNDLNKEIMWRQYHDDSEPTICWKNHRSCQTRVDCFTCNS